jgi:hypothetical protein
MRSKLLERYYREEDDKRAENFVEKFSLLERLLDDKKENALKVKASKSINLEVITAQNDDIEQISQIGSTNSVFKIQNNYTGKREELLKVNGRQAKMLFQVESFSGYVISDNSKIEIGEFGRSYIRPGEIAYLESQGKQFVVSYVDTDGNSVKEKSQGARENHSKHIFNSVIIHAVLLLMFSAASLFNNTEEKMTKAKLDKFVSVDLSKLKPRKKEIKKVAKKKVVKKDVTKKIAKKKVVKKKRVVVKASRKKIKNPRKAVAKRTRSKSSKVAKASSKSGRGRRAATSTGKRRVKGRGGYGKRVAKRRATPSVASSSLFKNLGGIGASNKRGGGNKSRILAAVSNIKGVKSSKAGVYNISGAIGKAGTDNIQIVRGGTVQTNGFGTGTGVGGGGRSRASGYASSLGQRAQTGAVAGAVVDFPDEDEGKILAGQGSLSRAEILKVIERNARSFRYCYEKQLVNNPNLQGRVVLSWTIGMSGSVNRAKWKASQIRNRNVNTCLISKLRALNFPKPKNNPVTIDFPFVFSSASF